MAEGPLKSGYLRKRGSGFFTSLSKHRRFFSLDAGGFSYKEDAASPAPAKRIDVFLSTIVAKSSNALDIVTSTKTCTLEFESQAERDSWHVAIVGAQAARAAQVEGLVGRLERALETYAAKANVSMARTGTRAPVDGARKPSTPAELLSALDSLTRRLEQAVPVGN
ncbi:hypothetical protein T492DRAFT_1023087 [Pavlovales sp. CCMP2436]|nr:hypothetical protein T492DRAFT_1023087 [Pavlovales sp. CCMP2436]|mmetsp:Transcript_31488/g.73322  ORF Transcript_31488/g.73322 Transcript_31488/m.73322 type:complete len:166 (+) Transcript_31488:59-556(+)